jgi:galactokinase
MMPIPDLMKAYLERISDGRKVRTVISCAPGRVEVLGNHTDYNGGMVLAATIDRYVWSMGRASDDVKVYSIDYDESTTFSPKGLNPSGSRRWYDYVKGVYWALKNRGYEINGIDAVIHGNVPQGAGLSSSAALEVSVANAVVNLSRLMVPPKETALAAFDAERLYCGVSCGIMDQFTAQLGKPDSLLAIFCSTYVTEDVPVNTDTSLVITDSMVPRAAGDALNQRMAECQAALRVLRDDGWSISSLSEIRPDQLKDLDRLLEDKLARRVRHVVLENQRVSLGMLALKEGRIKDFGRMMYQSHSSSRNLYEVSHPRLDFLVDTTRKMKGVFGSRMTGAGFGGSVISLVARKQVDSFMRSISSTYEKETGVVPNVLSCRIPGGVRTEQEYGKQ